MYVRVVRAEPLQIRQFPFQLGAEASLPKKLAEEQDFSLPPVKEQ
jgi:hypothetical protein